MVHRPTIPILYFILVLLFSGCSTYVKRVDLIPQKTPTWKKLNENYYKSGCNQGEIEISPLLLEVQWRSNAFFFIPIPFLNESLETVNEEGPQIYIKLLNKTRIPSCELSFVSLEDQESGHQTSPSKAETSLLNDDHLEIHQTDCRYFFDLKKDSQAKYYLHISREVLNCDLKPIPFSYKKSLQSYPMQMM